MKIKTILMSMLAVAALASCNNDDESGAIEEKAPLVVTLPGSSISTYAVEEPQAAGQITPLYNDAMVYLVDAGDNATGYVFSDAELSAKKKQFEEIVLPSKVIVIANKGNAGLPTGKTTVSAINNALNTLTVATQNNAAVTLAVADAKGNAAGDYISVQQVTLYGETSTISDMDDWDPHDAKKADVELKSLVSRFEVGTVKAGTGLTDLTVEDVYVNFFYKENGKTTNQSFTETTWPLTLATPAVFTPTWATDVASATVTSQAGTKAYAYQMFAGNLVPHIIFKVSGTVADGYKLSDGTTGDFTGKYITITGYKESGSDITAIEAHKIYKLGLTNGGIEITPEIITPKPEQEKFDLQVNITVADWTSAEVTPNI